MTYDPKTKTLRVNAVALDRAYDALMYSLKKIRLVAGKPLDKYKQSGPLGPDDFAMKGILDAAEALGIEMHASWGNEIDLRDVG